MKTYNLTMRKKEMTVDEAIDIVDEMYQDKFDQIEKNNVIHVDKIDGIKFTNLEFASVRLLREIQSLRSKIKDKSEEIINMREMIVRVARTLEKKGKYELSEYILAQIEATPTFTTWEEYITWIPKKKVEDKILQEWKKCPKNSINDFVITERNNKIQVLQELLEE